MNWQDFKKVIKFVFTTPLDEFEIAIYSACVVGLVIGIVLNYFH